MTAGTAAGGRMNAGTAAGGRMTAGTAAGGRMNAGAAAGGRMTAGTAAGGRMTAGAAAASARMNAGAAAGDQKGAATAGDQTDVATAGGQKGDALVPKVDDPVVTTMEPSAARKRKSDTQLVMFWFGEPCSRRPQPAPETIQLRELPKSITTLPLEERSLAIRAIAKTLGQSLPGNPIVKKVRLFDHPEVITTPQTVREELKLALATEIESATDEIKSSDRFKELRS
jgi:hypothetical protein